MDANNLEQNKSEMSDSCKSALSSLSKDASNQALVQNVLKACPADVPSAFPAAHDLIQNTAQFNPTQEKQDLRQLEKAIQGGFWGADKDTVIKVLTNSNSAERAQLSKDYEADKHEPLLQTMAEKFDGTASQNYHQMKGLLLRDDSKEALAAVNLHMQLMQIDEQNRQNDLHNKGTQTGIDNNLIDNGDYNPGTAGAIDALGTIAGAFLQHSSNNDLASTISKLTPTEVSKIESEHERIYRRDIGDLVENTHGLSDKARQSFKHVGIE